MIGRETVDRHALGSCDNIRRDVGKTAGVEVSCFLIGQGRHEARLDGAGDRRLGHDRDRAKLFRHDHSPEPAAISPLSAGSHRATGGEETLDGAREAASDLLLIGTLLQQALLGRIGQAAELDKC